MRPPLKIFAVLPLLTFLTLVPTAESAVCQGSLLLGLNAGPGALGNLTVSNISASLPLRLRLGLGFATMNPGKAEDARRVFINDNSGGTPEKHGRFWTIGLDLVQPLSATTGRRIDGYIGPRYGMFDGHFRYVGDNEEFDVTGRSWGAGAGLEVSADISSRFALLVSGGAEYYRPGNLHGHDATYSPNDDNVNSRKDYQYDDADEAINQPSVEMKLMGGVNYRFGR
jgi:hypothetical protein